MCNNINLTFSVISLGKSMRENIIPTLLLIIGFVILFIYLTIGYILPFGIHHIILFIVALVGITLFWEFLEYTQNYSWRIDERFLGRTDSFYSSSFIINIYINLLGEFKKILNLKILKL